MSTTNIDDLPAEEIKRFCITPLIKYITNDIQLYALNSEACKKLDLDHYSYSLDLLRVYQYYIKDADDFNSPVILNMDVPTLRLKQIVAYCRRDYLIKYDVINRLKDEIKSSTLSNKEILSNYKFYLTDTQYDPYTINKYISEKLKSIDLTKYY